jgi:hypothetical protein
MALGYRHLKIGIAPPAEDPVFAVRETQKRPWVSMRVSEGLEHAE